MQLKLPPFRTENQRGFTVVELMIAIAIASILMLGVMQTFIMSRHTYKLDDALARAQENARYAVNYLSREIRMAGYVGCRTTNVANVLNNSSSSWMYDFNNAIQGWEGNVSIFPTEFAANVIPGTDAFVVLYAGGTPYQITRFVPASATFTLNTVKGLSEGDILMVSDCNQASIFQISSQIQRTEVQDAGNLGSTSPGNCSRMLGSPVPTPCNNSASGGSTYPYGNNAVVYKMVAAAYYIGQSPSGSGHALFRMPMTQGGIGKAEVLADGVEDMQVLYGVDTNNNPPTLANEYITADQVAALPNGFKSVVSVRLGLLVETTDNVTKSTDNKNYDIADTLIYSTPNTHSHPADHRLRFQITTTIQLRNR